MILPGFFMIIAGGAYSINQEYGSKTAKIILLTTFIIVIMIRLLINAMNFNEGDEMSKSHFQAIRASTYRRLLTAILVCGAIGVVFSFVGIQFVSDWYGWILVLIGVNDFISGIQFYLLERGSMI